MIQAVIFDCFGVIITDALQTIRQEVEANNPDAAQAISDIVAANNRGLMEPGESNERIAAILDMSPGKFHRQVETGEVRNQEILDYIVRLRQTYKTAMLSNIASSSLNRRFPGDELSKYFDLVVASGDIGYAKPEPEAYEITADRLGLRTEECVFIDDRQLFVEGAQSVGMQALLYTDFTQLKAELESLLTQK